MSSNLAGKARIISSKVQTTPIIEIFGPTIQGEGLLSGVPTHFLRTGGCGYRCEWCDTMYAVDPEQVKANSTHMTLVEIMHGLAQLGPAPWLSLTGGDPCMHKGLADVISAWNHQGGRINVETQGQLFPDWLMQCDVITFSPKPPSAKMKHKAGTDLDKLTVWLIDHRNDFKGRICIKVVIFSEEDLVCATNIYKRLTPELRAPLYYQFWFTAGTDLDREPTYLSESLNRAVGVLEQYNWLAERVLGQIPETTYNERVRVGCQLHTLLWPDKTRGV